MEFNMARHRYKWRIAGFIFKALCMLIIAAIVILLLWRMIDNNNDPKEMDTVIPNALLVDAMKRGTPLTPTTRSRRDTPEEKTITAILLSLSR